MRGASRQALAQARETLDAELVAATQSTDATVADELLSVARLLARETGLARALSDAGTEPAQRVRLVDTLFGPRLGAPALGVLRTVVGLRWSSANDLVDGIELLGAQAAFEEAARVGSLDEVEDELFRFARIVERAPGLSSAFANPTLPAENKVSLAHSLLSERASPITTRLVESVVAALRGRTPSRALDELADEAARRRQREIAVVRVAAPMDEELKERLVSAIGRSLGKDVRLQVEIDPDVVGGVVVQIGDEVIDGSVARRLAQVRRDLTS
ncbi:MAG TPA: F0F1 ATP synthase subunit delta [Actinomycetes bacterium]|nr:F0F1 ATP synthase subunit delta [Actinomycetes bacterium]